MQASISETCVDILLTVTMSKPRRSASFTQEENGSKSARRTNGCHHQRTFLLILMLTFSLRNHPSLELDSSNRMECSVSRDLSRPWSNKGQKIERNIEIASPWKDSHRDDRGPLTDQPFQQWQFVPSSSATRLFGDLMPREMRWRKKRDFRSILFCSHTMFDRQINVCLWRSLEISCR